MIKNIEKLVSLVAKENMKALQIGVWKGDSVLQYLDIIRKNNGTLYCIDYFQGNPTVDSGEHEFKPKESIKVYNEFLNNTKDYKENIIIIKENSLIAYKKLPKDILFDFIFVDGDHRYSIVKEDIENYYPFLKQTDSIIAGHDYNNDYKPDKEYQEYELETDTHLGVSKAVNEFFKDTFSLFEINKEIWYYKR